MPRLPRAAAGSTAPRKQQQQQQQQQPPPPQPQPQLQQQRQLRPYRRPRKPEVRISQLILQALSARKQRGGLSLTSLRKALLASGYDVERNKNRVQMAIKSLVNNGSLVQTKATGSLKLSGSRQAEEAEPPALPAQEEPSASQGEEANPVKKPRRRRAERKAKPRKARK